MNKLFIACMMVGFASTGALAADGQLTLTGKVRSIAVIGVPFGGHKAGNFEVEVIGGFVPPTGVNCTDHTYLTTLITTDPDGRILELLESYGRKVVTITDDPGLQAFQGRCSIKAIEI